MSVNKVVITGGPCAGKSTGIKRVRDEFKKMGYTVLVIEETATELANSGITPESCGSLDEFERHVLKLQLERESEAGRKLEGSSDDKVLILCDRAAMDCKAYMSPGAFEKELLTLGTNDVELLGSYDGVFHMLTTAKGMPEIYTTANNSARRESAQEAVLADDAVIRAWVGHPHMRIIENEPEFADKAAALISEIAFFLGEPEPLEIERKFLVEYPDIEKLKQNTFSSVSEIVQTYFVVPGTDTLRVRQRGSDGKYIYYKTEKKKISDITRVEIEDKISRQEYERMLRELPNEKHQLKKDRYCFFYNNQYFELDVFPFWNDRALLEIELKSENEDIELPDFLNVIREVSHEKQYRNSQIAKEHNMLQK